MSGQQRIAEGIAAVDYKLSGMVGVGRLLPHTLFPETPSYWSDA